MKKLIRNPILPGFNPDPSIIRVGDDYFIATSTFEWFPGVQIHHSKDLVNWRLASRVLSSASQLDMKGVRNSGGVWAPCLSYSEGLFYLVYSNVLEFESGSFDAHNFLVTTRSIFDEWSEPVYLMSGTADLSLFHNDDGRKWMAYPSPRGIIIREYSLPLKKLIGPETVIFKGTELGITEGPHLYKINGYYYLITAEGGTEMGHAVTVARSKDLHGPYEVDPAGQMLTSRNNLMLELQKAGHADIVQTQNGDWYMVHLCGRSIPSRGMCILGRETCIQKIIWSEEQWLRLEEGGNEPYVDVPAPELAEQKWEKAPDRCDFDSETLDINFQTLRIPLDEDTLSLKERPGYLRLKGSESLRSRFHQALVARRQQSFRYTAETCVEFEPESKDQMAGLVCYYNTNNFYYLRITRLEGIGKCIGILSCNNKIVSCSSSAEICIKDWEKCYLQARMDYDKLRFYYSEDGMVWKQIGQALDSCILTDEYHYSENLNFTGAFVGLCCQDLTGSQKHADFDYFEYAEVGF